ncbi:hypothetical protein CCU68_17550 [Pseudomonas gingeri NCPPB 3146 = LMG 5327]|uniref:Uncharacterized protein n=1 Tax=Pseudomonas gingeri NCPPB 3146 = LMG 5327 TaxID=707248 RepID=A0ABX4Y286_9PSED|nr:hypothetical protein CCU68_17550 [Pseudomonas gingeri NCPPB 3146 = LMG 5327]
MRAPMIVPTLCVGMPHWTLRVRSASDAERHGLHAHAERGNDQVRLARTSGCAGVVSTGSAAAAGSAGCGSAAAGPG